MQKGFQVKQSGGVDFAKGWGKVALGLPSLLFSPTLESRMIPNVSEALARFCSLKSGLHFSVQGPPPPPQTISWEWFGTPTPDPGFRA